MLVSDHFFRHRFDPPCFNGEPDNWVAQVELLVETVGEGSDVRLGIPAVLQRFEGTLHHGFEVPQKGIDPVELWWVQGLGYSTTMSIWMHPASATATQHPWP
jgi:hypothetical protein